MSIVDRNHNACRTSKTFLWCGIWLLLYLAGLLWIYPSVGNLPTFSVASIKLKIIHLHLAFITTGLLLVHYQLIKLDNDSSFSCDLFCSDPVESLKQNKKKALYSLLFFILAAHYGFLDVLRYEHTMVSAPHIGLPGQPPFGNSYNADAGAGSLIEGPGIWVTNQYLKHGHLPLWNPYEGCGAPYLANGETAALSLIQLPLHLSPSLKLWNIYAVSRMVLAGWFASLFFLGVGFSGIPSILGGLAFAFGGSFVLYANLVHLNTALWLPLILLFTEALLFRISWWRWMGLVLVFGLALNGGNPQPAMVISVILLFRLLWPTMEKEGWKNWIVKRVLIVSALVSGCILTAPTLLPLAEMLGKSASRGMSGNILPLHLQSFLFFGVPPDLHSISTFGVFFLPPWLYLGTFVLFLFLAGMFFYFTNRNPHVGHLSIWFTLVMIYLFFLHTWVGAFLLSNIPILRGIIWIKYISAFNLLIAFFAVFALNTILRCGDKRGYLVAACSVLFLTLFLCCARFEIASIQLWVIAVTSIIVISFTFLSRQSVIYISLFMPLIVLMELSIYHPDYPLNSRLNCKDFPALPKSISKLHTGKNARDIAPSRIFALGNVLPPLSSSIFKLEDIRTVSPVPLKHYHRWLQMSIIDNGGAAPPYRLPVSGDALLSPILDIAGVRHVLTKQKIHKYFFDGPVKKSPYILWASFMGSIVPESLSIEKLYRVDGQVGLFEGGKITFNANLPGSAIMGFYVSSENKKAFRAKIGIGDDVRLISEAGEYVWDMPLKSREQILHFIFEVVEGGPVILKVKQFDVDLHYAKSLNDYNLLDSDEESGLYVYENRTALPIVSMNRKVRYVQDENETFQIYTRLLAEGRGWDWKKELLIIAREEKRLVMAPTDLEEFEKNANEIASFTRPDPNQMLLEIDAVAPGWIYMAVTYDEHWKAELNQHEVPVCRANGPFMAVYIPEKGAHILCLRYRPWPFFTGAILGGLMLLFLVIGTVVKLADRKLLF